MVPFFDIAAKLNDQSTLVSLLAGGFDSLSAVELSNKIGQAVGLDLPGTLVFDYPSVSSIAAYLLPKLAPKPAATSQPAAVHITDIQPLLASSLLPSLSGPQDDAVIHVSLAARLPSPAYCDGGSGPAAGHDAISTVPFDRWDLEAARVSVSLPPIVK